MTALGAEVSARFASAFALLVDLRQLAPDEHGDVMRAVIAHVAAITKGEQTRRLAEGVKP